MARMVALLNGAEVSRRLGVSRNAVHEWATADDPPAERVAQVRELMLRALGDEQAEWPPWARTMDAKLDTLLARSDDSRLVDALHEARRTIDAPAPDEDPPMPTRPRSGGRR